MLQVNACVAGMFDHKEFQAFKQHLRDFLVQTKQFADKVGTGAVSTADVGGFRVAVCR